MSRCQAPGHGRRVGSLELVIRGVILDYGGVLSLEPTDEALARLHALCELDAAVFADAWLEHRHGYDLGELSAADYWELVTGRRYDGELLDCVVAADVDSWARTDPRMVDWLRALGDAGLRVGVLSNMPREHWLDFERRHDWLALCDHVTVSWERGAVKPDESIYRDSLEGLALEPHEAVFVDDRPDNVQAAEKLGLHAVLFAGVEALRDELARRYGDALPLPLA
jgi:putative hydrolase of the HAD superfamily